MKGLSSKTQSNELKWLLCFTNVFGSLNGSVRSAEIQTEKHIQVRWKSRILKDGINLCKIAEAAAS